MDKFVIDKIKEWMRLGYGNIVIRQKLMDEGITISNKKIWKVLCRFKDEFFRSHILANFDSLISGQDYTIVHAKVRKGKHRVRGPYIEFSLAPLRKLALTKEIRVVPYFSKDLTKILIFPVEWAKEKLYTRKNSAWIKFTFSRFIKKEDLKKLPKDVDLTIPLNAFGLSDIQTIIDVDARKLFKELKKNGWSLSKFRITDRSEAGDLFVISPNGKKFLIEISAEGKTMKFSKQIRKFLRQRLAGKAFIQSALAKKINATYVMILWSGLLDIKLISNGFQNACKTYGVRLIFTDFDKTWPKDVSNLLNTFTGA